MNNLTGKTFGRLLALKDSGERSNKHIVWTCLCLCGTFTKVPNNALKSGNTRSCGCLLRETVSKRMIERERLVGKESPGYKHGGSVERLYKTWSDMKNRCYNPNNQSYERYGGRGVTVYPEWLDYIPFRKWALSHGYADNLTIDKINNDGNYEPHNCQFITKAENARKGREE